MPPRTIAGTQPAEGETGVARDAALIIETQAAGEATSTSGSKLGVRVTTADGEAVAGALVVYWWQQGVTLWRSARPLSANTDYVAHLQVDNQGELASDAAGSVELDVHFRTGEQLLPGLDVPVPQLTFEPYEAEAMECQSESVVARPESSPPIPRETGGCPLGRPYGCKPAGRRLAAQARLKVGPIGGGDPSQGYRVSVLLAEDPPLALDPEPDSLPVGRVGTTLLEMHEGDEQTFALQLPEREADYRACVQLRIVDAAGHVFDWTGPCEARSTILGLAGATQPSSAQPGSAQPGVIAAGASAPPITDPLPPDGGTASAEGGKPAPSGCSIVPPGQLPTFQPSPAWYCLLALLAARRAKRARRGAPKGGRGLALSIDQV